MVRLRVLITLITLALAGCNSPAVPPQQNYGTVYGTVNDAVSGAPIANATVTVDQVLVATTGANGTFTINNVPTGSFSWTAIAAGYAGRQDSSTVGAGERYLLTVTLSKQ